MKSKAWYNSCMIYLFDTHCHLDDEMIEAVKTDPGEIKYICDIGVNLETSTLCTKHAKENDFCYAAVGFQPEEVPEFSESLLADCMELLSEPKVVAIGEIGLDYHWEDNPPKEAQKKWFAAQLAYAVEKSMPVCIHSRDSEDDTMRMLKESRALGNIPVLLHCFSGSAELARQYMKYDVCIALGGPVTFKNSRKAVEVASFLPRSNLLTETDAPYLSPEPKRGTKNCPQNMMFTARRLAEIKNIEYEELAAATFENACRFYGVKP